MSAVVSQITGVSMVYPTVCLGTDQRKHQSSASLAFVRGIHQWLVDSPHKAPVTRKMFPFDDVIMIFPMLWRVMYYWWSYRCFKATIDDKPVLLQVMTWCLYDAKSSPEINNNIIYWGIYASGLIELNIGTVYQKSVSFSSTETWFSWVTVKNDNIFSTQWLKKSSCWNI